MMDVVLVGGTKDGTGAGDCDCAYTWDHPREYLTLMQQGWLTILRGYVMDTRRGGEARNCASDDLAYAEQLNSGLIIPCEPQ